MMECWQNRTLLEKKSLVTLIVLFTVIIGLITLILTVTEPKYCHHYSCTTSYEHIMDKIDPHADPCDNVYNFICGGPTYRTQKNKTGSRKILEEIISEPVSRNDTKSLMLQKQFYHSCSNLEAIDADNDTTFWNLIRKLGGWPVVSGNNWNESAFDFVEFMVELRDMGLQHDWFLDISVFSNRGTSIILEINVPDNANKIEENIADEHVNFMVDAAVAFGAHENVAKSQMPEVMYFENKLANLIDEIHNENKLVYRHRPLQLITINDVQKEWQKINWLELLNHLTKKKLKDNQQVAFHARNYMPQLDKLLKQTTKRTQVNYVVWKLVEAYSPYLSKKIRDLVLNYSLATNQTELWDKDRKNFCFEESKSYFQYTLEAAYLRRHVTERTRRNIEVIIEAIREQMEQYVRETTWMDQKIKTVAITMLRNVTYIIGGPEEMYKPEQFDRNFGIENVDFNSTNIIDITVEIFHKGLEMLFNKKYEDLNYLNYTLYDLVTSQEMEFYQNINLLWVPAGILHGFFYDNDRSYYLNYGTMGTTIANMLTYGLYSNLFRNSGIWSNITMKNFAESIECFKNCSDGLNFTEISCQENLLDNIADYTGINLSFKAYQKWLKENISDKRLHGLDFTYNQMFWLAYGSMMCHLPVPELNYSRFDHMMQSFRIVGSFRNSPYFAKDFRCELGSNMHPREKCQIL